jgi:long-chain acyl-CoA synthetase
VGSNRGPNSVAAIHRHDAGAAEAEVVLEGDLGALDEDGSLRIIGRKKDVFNCNDGSNIYPGFIELRLENESFIRQSVLLGDRRPFVAALVVPDRKRIADSLAREMASLTDEEIETKLWSQIERVNAGLESYEQVRRMVVMKNEFPLEVRSINQFQKVRIDRKAVAAHYAQEIASVYGETQGVQS